MYSSVALGVVFVRAQCIYRYAGPAGGMVLCGADVPVYYGGQSVVIVVCRVMPFLLLSDLDCCK
jgi:hypothetical protein